MTIIKNKYIILSLMVLLSNIVSAQTTSDSLQYYLKAAALNNPGVKSDFLAYKAFLQKIPQAGAYQDPQLEIGFYLEPMDIIGGKQVADFTLMQMFPWFGTKKAAQTEATYMAKAAFEKFRETRDNLYLDIYSQWYILCSLQQQLKNSMDNKSLLMQLEQLALRKFSSPSANSGSGYPVPEIPSPSSNSSVGGSSGMSSMSSMGGTTSTATATTMQASSSMSSMGGAGASGGMSDVLRIQLEIAELESNIESITSEIKAEKTKFNALLNRPAESEIQIPEKFEQTPFILDIENAKAKMNDQNPMLSMIVQDGFAYKAKAEMDKKMGYPMLGIGVQYMLNKKTNDPMFGMGDMNGKDMIMPMVSVSIPIYRNKYKAQQREGKLWWQSNQEKYTNTYNILEAELYKTKHLLDDALRKTNLYKKQSDLAQTTYNLVVQEFIVGKSDLTNVIQVQRQLLDYQLKEAESIANYNTMVASIQRLISFKDTEQNVNTIYNGNE